MGKEENTSSCSSSRLPCCTRSVADLLLNSLSLCLSVCLSVFVCASQYTQSREICFAFFLSTKREAGYRVRALWARWVSGFGCSNLSSLPAAAGNS